MAPLAEQLIKSLHALGVRHVFGIPGGPSIPYMDAMRQNGVEFVLVSNEQSAGMMADVCGRLTGIPGVCHATFGPGATNLATGVGGALLDRSPLIAFTTEVKDADIGRKVQMNIDHQALYRPLTKWTTRMSDASFRETLTRAVAIATAEVPGPVHIGLPSDIDGAAIGDDDLVTAYDRKTAPLPETARLTEAVSLIKKAKRPILAIGLSAARLGFAQAVRQFAGKSNIPVLLTPMAKGLIAASHPCYAGVLFHANSDIVADIYRSADLVIGLGYDPIEFNYESWMPAVPLIHIDSESADITADYKVACEVVGDLAASLAYLNARTLPVYAWDLAELKTRKEKLFQSLTPAADAFTPSELFAVLRRLLPQDGIITGDVGAHLHLLGQLWQVEEPQRFIMTNGWSTMGFGLPAAIGAKLCRPTCPVVCINGDGGFLMNCGELMTARRLGINVVVIVLCDKYLSLIEVKQNWRKVPQYGTDLYRGDYFAADKFLGAPIFKVHDAGEMAAALPKALSVAGPAIIEAVVDGSVYGNLITRSYK